MKIVTIGRGNVGGGLAAVWRVAGHEVTELGREGGDASGADAVLLAVPAGQIDGSLEKVAGLGRAPIIDATNAIRDPQPEGYASFAEYVRSQTGAPVSKAFNSNFAKLYDRIAEAGEKPSMVYAADDDARQVTEQLITDAGYEPAYAGDLTNARAVEDFIGVIFAVAGQRGPFLSRIY
jgi:8-hydroxy-5-deazaflavin:NADPH oxidoreductase